MMDWTSWLPWMTVLASGLASFGSRGGPRAVGPAVAGSWYPDDGAVLARTVDDLLQSGKDQPDATAGRVVALIEPHAGFVYSGGVAGRGFHAVRGRDYRRVLLLGPSHYGGFQGAALPDADVYRTPLGDVPIDRDAVTILETHPRFSTSNRAFKPEHSLEAEIPFLQRCLEPGWTVVPVLLGAGSSGAIAQEIADGLRPLLDGKTLVVVSSDFTHYGPRFGYVPFTENVPGRIRELDLGAVRLVESRDVRGFEEYVNHTGATICGRNGIAVLLRMLPAGTRGELLAYDTSGRMTGDWDHSVSYAALSFREAAGDAP